MAQFIDKLKGGISFWRLLFFLIVLGLIIKAAEKPDSTVSPPSPPRTVADKAPTQPAKDNPVTPAANYPDTPADRLKEAKKQLAMKSPDRPYGDIYYASNILKYIDAGAPEYPEAQALLKKIRKLEEKDLADIRKKTAEDRHAKRIIYAPLLENRFLDKGYDISVKTLGKGDTTLQIKYILTSRVFVHHVSKDAKLIAAWREMGFKKVIITDGYRSKWWLDL